ncbi:MAG: bifunctional DNA-formamidopyrimidine glycosylase/DNA-(apurinic or apyrimidinic site) lyase [Desulfonatronovibrionaceae bacterium]
MPELPEVETIARGLQQVLPGRVIKKADVRYAGTLRQKAESFKEQVQGRTIVRVWRRGKLLIFDLDARGHLVFHLKMTGRVLLPDQDQQPDRHTHLIFALDNASRVFFHDQRKFGYCRLFDAEGLCNWSFFQCLGPEPHVISAGQFARRFIQKKARIKALLLDQSMVAGIGNIYADESLFMAGIHPETPAHRLSLDGLADLHSALVNVLDQAIAAGGSSFRDYRNAQGQAGMFQEKFLIYGRKGRCCPRCDASVESVRVAGRSSCICPVCQVLPEK